MISALGKGSGVGISGANPGTPHSRGGPDCRIRKIKTKTGIGMIGRRRPLAWAGAALVLAAILATVFFLSRRNRQEVVVRGAVMMQSTDPRKELPLADVEITAAQGLADAAVKSDSSGFFALHLHKGVRKNEPVILRFRHPNYRPLDLGELVGNKLYIAHLVPLAKDDQDTGNRPSIGVGNVRVRYSIKGVQDVNIGSAVRIFQVENTGNVPCKSHAPCSPDGTWKASIGSASLDAGAGNEFRDARVSCIAGPCPFTKIDSDGFSRGGQTISVSARCWSDTTTFLVEAEVFRKMASEVVHESYPVIFGPALNFTVPTGAEGISIEADISGETIIFPLGPALFLRWANCNARVNREQTNVYRCELKPGYRFRG